MIHSSRFFLLQKRKFRSDIWLTRCHLNNMCQSWDSNLIQLVPELEVLALYCMVPDYLHPLIILFRELTQQGKVLTWSTLAGNVLTEDARMFERPFWNLCSNLIAIKY